MLKKPRRPKIFGSLVELKDWERGIYLYKEGVMDGLELRLDAFSDKELDRLYDHVARGCRVPPLIVTARSHLEGGLKVLTDRDRKQRLVDFLPFASMVDCELRSTTLLRWLKEETRRQHKKLIVSYHDFSKSPSCYQIQQIFSQMKAYQPDIYKMAFHISKQSALLPLMEFLGQHTKCNLVMIGMGKEGALSRFLFPALGSSITFGSIGTPSAPGQLSVSVLKQKISRLIPR